jgi:hypothetical protein
MDCSICLAAIETGTSSATTSCGHAFHFGCLATWSKTKSTCPLCRQAFTETDAPAEILPGGWGGPVPGVMSALAGADLDWEPVTFRNRHTHQTTTLPLRSDFRRQLQRELDRRYALRPLEWSVVEGLDPVDIAFIVEKAKVDAGSAKAYLTFYKTPIDTIMMIIGDEFHIPTFRERSASALAEPYVSRDTRAREGITPLTSQLHLHEDGYESV